MKTSKHKVVITEMEHRSKACYGIGFPYNYELKVIVNSINHVRWSASKKLFYVAKEKLSLHYLYTSLNEKGVYVDYSRVKTEKRVRPVKKSKRVARKISAENKDVIRAFVRYLRGLRLSENTVKVYFTFVADFVEFIDEKALDELTATDVRLFVERQVEHKRYAISTHRQLVSALKHFGTFLPDSKIVVEDLIRPSKSRYLPTVLSKEEVIDLLRATRNLKHRAVLALLYSAGLRIGEVLNLKLRDIDIDRRQIFIKNAKGRKDRVVIMAESFIPLYKNYYLTYKPVTYFIENPDGGVYSPGSIRKFIKISSNRAGIKKRVTPHTLRHSYATHLIENGVGLRHVQDLLGHSRPETTMIYTHVAKKDLLKIQSPLDTAFIALTSGDKKHQKVRLSQNNPG
jgi:integrase/recombinase XerD